MKRAEEERVISAFACFYFHTFPGGGSASSRLNRWYVSALRADWIRDVDLSLQAYWLITMESVYGLGRHDMMCAYVSHGEYILSRAVHKRPRLAPFLRPLRWHKLKLTSLVRFRRRTLVRLNVWPTGGMNDRSGYTKFFW